MFWHSSIRNVSQTSRMIGHHDHQDIWWQPSSSWHPWNDNHVVSQSQALLVTFQPIRAPLWKPIKSRGLACDLVLLCYEPGTTGTRRSGHFMIDHLDLFVIFMDFPKPIKNTQSLHCAGRVSFHFNILTWPKNVNRPLLQLSLWRLEACLIPILRLNITTSICQSVRSGNWM